jgi:hypothetical protein
MVGDDLGSLNYLLAQVRLEFTNLPLLRQLNIKSFTYAELALYPHLQKFGNGLALKDSARFSLGYGLSLPLGPQISILVYYNALNFCSKPGDHERHGFINLNMGFF